MLLDSIDLERLEALYENEGGFHESNGGNNQSDHRLCALTHFHLKNIWYVSIIYLCTMQSFFFLIISKKMLNLGGENLSKRIILMKYNDIKVINNWHLDSPKV